MCIQKPIGKGTEAEYRLLEALHTIHQMGLTPEAVAKYAWARSLYDEWLDHVENAVEAGDPDEDLTFMEYVDMEAESQEAEDFVSMEFGDLQNLINSIV